MHINVKSRYRLIDTCAFLLLVIALAGCGKEVPPHPASHYPAFYGEVAYQDSLYSPVAQEKTERVFLEQSAEKTLQFTVSPAAANEDTPAGIILSKPVHAGVNQATQELFLLDTETQLIYVFSIEDGTLKRTISTIKDKRETQNYGITLQVTPDQKLMVTGIKPAEFTWLDLKGEITGNLKIESGNAVANVTDGKQVVIRALNVDELFHVYDANHKLENSFGYLSSRRPLQNNGKEHPGHGLGFMGSVNSDGGDTFIYDSATGGGLAKFKLDGSLIYYRSLLHPGKYFSMKQDSIKDSMSLDYAGEKSNYYMPINLWEGVYYQRAMLEDNGDEIWIIDAYDYKTGDYLYSLKDEMPCGTITITAEHKYVHCLDEGFFQVKRNYPFVSEQAELAANLR